MHLPLLKLICFWCTVETSSLPQTTMEIDVSIEDPILQRVENLQRGADFPPLSQFQWNQWGLKVLRALQEHPDYQPPKEYILLVNSHLFCELFNNKHFTRKYAPCCKTYWGKTNIEWRARLWLVLLTSFYKSPSRSLGSRELAITACRTNLSHVNSNWWNIIC